MSNALVTNTNFLAGTFNGLFDTGIVSIQASVNALLKTYQPSSVCTPKNQRSLSLLLASSCLAFCCALRLARLVCAAWSSLFAALDFASSSACSRSFSLHKVRYLTQKDVVCPNLHGGSIQFPLHAFWTRINAYQFAELGVAQLDSKSMPCINTV